MIEAPRKPSAETSARGWLVGGGEMGERIRAFDWAATPLGPVETWSPALRTTVGIMLANRFPLLLWWGPDYISIYNDPYGPILGAKHPWGLGKPVRECWSEIWHVLQPLIDAPFKDGEATWNDDIELEINRHGFVEETHFTIAYSPVPDASASNGIGGVLATVHEITEKVVGERRVTILRDLLQRVAEARSADTACAIAAKTLGQHPRDVPFALIYLVDADGNQAQLAGTAGIGSNEAMCPAVVSLDGGTAKTIGWPLAEAIRTRRMQIVDDLGSRFAELPPGPWTDAPHTAVVLPIPSSGLGQPAGLLVVGVSSRLRFDDRYRDFLELMSTQIATAVANARAYEEERKRTEALAEIDRVKTLFFSNVSHEFRTPLTLMLGPLEDSLASAQLQAADRERLDVAHRNSLRLLKLVNSLLDFSRIEAGRAQASYEPVDLAAFTTELASNFRAACERAGLALVVDCPPLPAPVYVDRDMWEKVILNLLSNAFKFTFDGQIAVRMRSVDGAVEVTVCDTGVGVPASELPRLFERFHRIAGQKSRSFEGSGIGLALVQELVKLHGGKIQAESAAGRGTTFKIALPFGSAHLPQDRIGAVNTLASSAIRAQAYVQEALRWLTGKPSEVMRDNRPTAKATQQRARVLVADDNADMRDYIRRLLDAEYEVTTVADGEAALRAMRDVPPDLVLTDVMMPRLDGFGLLREIRADPKMHGIPVIMLSGRAGEESKVEGLESGADDYLIKPFSARELMARVKAQLQLSSLRNDATAALRESEERFRMIADSAPCPVWLTDETGAMVFANAQFREITGKTVEQVAGDGWKTLIHPEDAPAMLVAREKAWKEGPATYTYHGRFRRHDGAWRWMEVFSRPRRENGKFKGYVGLAVDQTDTRESRVALEHSERQLRLITDSLPVLISLIDEHGYYRFCNNAYESWFGQKPDELVGKHMREVLGEEAYAKLEPLVKRAMAGETVSFETTAPYRYGGTRDVAGQYIPRFSQTGKVDGIFVLVADVTEQARTKRALVDSEERFRTISDNIAQLAWTCVELGDMVWFNQRWLDYTGSTMTEMKGWGWKSAVHPDHVDRVLATLAISRDSGEPWEDTFPLRGKNEEYRWFLTRAVPIRDEAGAVVRWFGTNTDITERIQSEETQQMLTGELSHRVKNMLATVQAIATQTLRHNRDPVQFAASFGGRIQSMSRVHAMLSNGEWKGAGLRDVIRDQVLLGPIDETRVTAWGPDVQLEPQLAPQVAMMLHELGTNSIKYGALSKPQGVVTINWTVANDKILLTWAERGGPPAQAPTKKGFGTSLIEQSAKGVGGDAQMSIDADGVRWEIVLPLPRPKFGTEKTTPPATSPVDTAARTEPRKSPSVLAGKRFLVVEDEPLVALDVAMTLEQSGVHVIGPVGTDAEALAQIEDARLDAALLDANLHGAPVDAIAAALTRKNVPFVFVTGYGRDGLPAAFASAAVLSKPFTQHQLLEAATNLVRLPADVTKLRG